MYYSPMWRKMRGMALDEPVDPAQEEWLARVHPDDRARIREIVDKQDSGEDGYDTLEYRERHRDGHYMWILSRGRPIEWDAKGTPIRTVGTDTDITRLKQVEASLAEEKERLRITLESIGDGVISTDAGMRITFMNPIAEDMTGWTSEEAIGRALTEVFTTLDQASGRPAVDAVARSLASGEAIYLDEEVALVGRHGERRDIRSSAAPVRTPQRGDHRRRPGLPGHHAEPGFAEGAGAFREPRRPDRTAQPGWPSTARLPRPSRRQARSGACTRCATSISTASSQSTMARGTLPAMHCCGRSRTRSAEAAGPTTSPPASAATSSRFSSADCPVGKAAAIAGKIVAAVRRLNFTWNGSSYDIGASIGVTAIGGEPASELGFAGEADAACYAAKRAGRGTVIVYARPPAVQ
ncbi:MAG: PAS domain-containing protein [Hyphomicrobium sp.]